VVLTPAVAAVSRRARAAPLPYLFICAFIANAASFTLPISNPANLVVFGNQLPPLAQWLARFALPSLAAVLVTFAALWLTQRRALRGAIAREVPLPELSAGARLAGAGIALTALALLGASAAGVALGLPAALAAVLTVAAALGRERASAWPLLRGVSWGVLPLVAGLFVLVAGIDRTGVLAELGRALQSTAHAQRGALWEIGIATALACNATNNLPLALVAGTTLGTVPLPTALGNAVLVGVDLGPNLSVTGSLATILWLIALRREGEHVSAARFLRLGVWVMLPALLFALLAIWLQ
jgi:arsenical pump membrane protein